MTNDYLEKQLYPEARITILQLLDKAPDGRSNAQMLTMLLQMSTTQLWLDQTVGQLEWLSAEKLVELEHSAGMLLAKITPAGAALARGLARHPGIDRPRSED